MPYKLSSLLNTPYPTILSTPLFPSPFSYSTENQNQPQSIRRLDERDESMTDAETDAGLPDDSDDVDNNEMEYGNWKVSISKWHWVVQPCSCD